MSFHIPDAAIDRTNDALPLGASCHCTTVGAAEALPVPRPATGGGLPGSGPQLLEHAAGRLFVLGELALLRGWPLARRLEVGPLAHDVRVATGTVLRALGRAGCFWSRTARPCRAARPAGCCWVRPSRWATPCGARWRTARGLLRVALRADADGVSPVMEDDGPKPQLLPAGDDDRDHRSVVVEPLARAAGAMALVIGRHGTRVTVRIPHRFKEGEGNEDDLF